MRGKRYNITVGIGYGIRITRIGRLLLIAGVGNGCYTIGFKLSAYEKIIRLSNIRVVVTVVKFFQRAIPVPGLFLHVIRSLTAVVKRHLVNVEALAIKMVERDSPNMLFGTIIVLGEYT